jgi:hypothetical protein
VNFETVGALEAEVDPEGEVRLRQIAFEDIFPITGEAFMKQLQAYMESRVRRGPQEPHTMDLKRELDRMREVLASRHKEALCLSKETSESSS